MAESGDTMKARTRFVHLCLWWLFKRHAKPGVSVEAIRRRLDVLKHFIANPPKSTTAVRVEAGGVSAVLVSTPQSLADRCVLYLHGGGYVFGQPSHYRDFIWRIASATAARVLVIDYRLAPEHPFPAALDDAAAAYRWLLQQGTDPRRIAVMGDSAGGGLTLATLLRLRDDGIPLPAAAVALSPWTDLTVSGESIERNAKSESMITPAQARDFAAHYLAGAEARHPHASPLYGDPASLPPVLLLVGSGEILLDDAVRMANRLRACGRRVELEIGPGMPHVWPLYARVLPESRQAITRIGAFVQREFGSAR